MKQARIEKVANGYIVNAGSGNFDSACVKANSDIHVFESFFSMRDWLHDYFEPEDKQSVKPGPFPITMPRGDEEL